MTVVVLVAGLLAAGGAVLWLAREPPPAPPAQVAAAEFAGTAACATCHAAEHDAWRGSDHDRAMMPATKESVLGDFSGATFEQGGVTTLFTTRGGKYFVETEGPGGARGEFEVAYTFGVRPLQQYLLPTGGGRYQALSIAWDVERRRWYSLYPDQKIPPSDWLHWTRGGQNWNGMCAECHSTNLRKGYDPATATFRTTWSDLNVGCEACHGPGSRHVAWAQGGAGRPIRAGGDLGLVVATRDLSGRAAVELCASCHARRAELVDYDHTAPTLLDQAIPATLSEGLYHADGQQEGEVYTYGSFVQSKMYAKGIGCLDCHDPHTAAVRAPGNATCTRCHNASGAALRDGIDGAGLVRKAYDDPSHHFHRAGGPGSACVDCHAPSRAYMGIDERHDHSFRVPRPDLSAATGAPNACSLCHADRSTAWAAQAVERWYGPGRRREPHFGTGIAAGRTGAPGADEALRALAGDAAQPVIARATALELLARYPGEATTSTWQAAAAGSEPWLRLAAASALAASDAPTRAAALAPLLADPVRAVRHAAVGALAGEPLALLAPPDRAAFERERGDYEAALRASLDFASSGFNLGNLYARLDQPAEAERFYRAALAVDDLFFPAKMNLAVLLSGQGRNAEAESLLREVAAADPANAEAASALGLLLAETGGHDEAVTWLEKTLALEPRRPRTAYNLGLLLAGLGRTAEARRTLETALATDPASYDLLFALADLELRQGRTHRALELAERMLALRPSDPTASAIAAAASRAHGTNAR